MKIKKYLSVLLVFITLLQLVPAAAWADAAPDDPVYSLRGDAAVLSLASADEAGKRELSEVSYNTVFTVPSGAALFVGQKPGSKHFVPFTAFEPVYISADGEAGTAAYYFDLSNGTYNYRISGPDYVTYAGKFSKSASDFTMTVTEAELKPEGQTKTTVDRDVAANNGYNVADIYLNINPQNYLKLADGAAYQLVNLRNWEIVDTAVGNYFIEPDYHYTVIDEAGDPSDSVVTVDESGLVTAQGKGTAIILVTYDAINYNGATGGPFFGAIWPENTGVFVVSVGAGESGIATGMTLNEGKNTTTGKLAGDAIDSEHDVIYFTGDQGSYTFTPQTAGCEVAVANPVVSETKMSFRGFVPVGANADGSFTVPLVQGRNIVRVSKGEGAEYQVITAKKVTFTVNDGDPVCLGDELKIKFEGLYHPANKLAGVYNMSAMAAYTSAGGEEKLVGSTSKQYNFASQEASQTVSGLLNRTQNSFGGVSYALDKKVKFTVPEDYASDTYTLAGGALIAVGFGDPYGNHRGITLEAGKDPNFTASTREAYLGRLPDIEIPVGVRDAELIGLTLDTANVKKDYYAGESFDKTNLVVTANYSNGQSMTVGGFTFAPEVLTAGTEKVTVTYQGKTAEIPLTVTPLAVTAIEITAPPAKTAYVAGDMFDTAGMVVTATYNNGTKKELTDYTYSPAGALGTDVTAITVKCGELTASTPVTVAAAPASSGGGDGDNITVYFTLYGDEAHGSPASAAATHTMKKGNLTVWLARTTIKVPKGSTVIDAVAKALGSAGIPYDTAGGSYIASIRGLAEFTNGNLSGWMYTLNGEYPDLGIDEQTLASGDKIVFHYTDDYTQERSTESLGGGSSGGAGGGKGTGGGDSAVLQPGTFLNGAGQNEAGVTAGEVNKAIEGAKEDNLANIIIEPNVKGGGSGIMVKVALDGARAVADAKLGLTVNTGKGSLAMGEAALRSIVSQAGGIDIRIIVEVKDTKTEAVKDAALSALRQAAGIGEVAKTQLANVTEVTVLSDNKAITSFGGHELTVSLPVDRDKFTEGSSYKVVVVSAGGTVETIAGKCIKYNGQLVVQVQVDHLSTFIVTSELANKAGGNTLSFADVNESQWFYEAVRFVCEAGLMNGETAARFDPSGSLNRAMLVTVLYRLEGEPKAAVSNRFSDIAAGRWYADAVSWASANGIVNGYEDGTFRPAGSVSREETAAMLMRYAEYKGINTSAAKDLSGYGDAAKVAVWARPDMAWASAAGLIQGDGNNNLNPQGKATRAEAAAILMRLVQNVIG